jgi:uncharacterized phage-associated protein
MLGKYHRPLLDEPVQAWRYGPVVPSVYNAVRVFGSAPVTTVSGANPEFQFSDNEREIMERVVNGYGKYNGITLSAATHNAGTPWSQTWTMFGKNAPISNDLIENFYGELLKKDKHSSL